MHKIVFYNKFISCLYMFRAHVLIIRRSKLYYTASGIITLIGGLHVHETATYRCDDTRGCVIQFWPPEDEYMCSKHVEAWNKLIVKHNFVLQVGQLLRCAVSKTSNSCLQLTLTLFSFCTFPRNVIVYFLPLQGQNPLQPTRMTVWWMQLW